ncbi:excinuclease ABC subunit UvrC [Cellulomonas fimi]|uniref:UvrABC system protein C n=1 Tax=Cellulomonas fimi (strain ATCC 484 / DSM 20113 / JCM 1341 / CCUG 24087 / LMG 16345 / NBRC 15513 / NCIMB 8980 / NCTC 7547 / NRS-133) TaxID=590998 RepID=F4GZ00_CELFA|nr:excinuclease ABC subunit UvrC [Cellulomonas fimi]AEE45990.1 excinuclease ABC, C subunit [Cellulomonas fimi ATCC 484]NNH06576.1 excinuclease ABC subunit UvrC [Cellulomonas fimi]VEH31212.1 Excinuclease ABC subunit C [Cellulomonas fimi]
MADPATYRPAPGEIPESPGVYRFRDEHGRVIYVGKAKSLRPRLSSYFQDVHNLHPRTQQMVTTAASVEWTVVPTEVAALALEYTWIKEFDPRFNVKYRDDKSYPYLAVTMSDEFPRVQVMRGAKRKGTRYFGPYAHAWAIRETVDLLLRVFPVRTCSAGVFKRAHQQGRPCLLGYIDKCSAPCVGRISPDDHHALAQDFCDFMAGDTARFTRRLTARMKEAAAELDYEQAARLRDDIATLEKATEKNAVVLKDGTDADIFALAGDDLEAAVQVFHVRDGRIRGQRGWVVEKVEDVTDAELVEHLLQQVYGTDVDAGTASVPREVLVPVLPPDVEQVQDWLAGMRGARVQVRVPQRGDKRELAATVHRNAEHALLLHRTRRAGDLTTRSQALREIQEALDLPSAPLRIECYDVSHNQGTFQSASMVVFEDGLARKGEYRLFNLRGTDGEGARDDTAAMHEVITRRFRRYLAERSAAGDVELGLGDDDEDAPRRSGPVDETTGKPQRFAYPPNLVVVDGGQPQVAAAAAALAELGIDDVALCGLAKRLEEVWLPGEDYPVILQRSSEGLYLLQRLRDEAHRFAISAHRRRRSKGMTASVLDDVPGLGPARRAALLRHFGSVKRLRAASVAEIASVQGMGDRTAAAVVAALSGGPDGSGAASAQVAEPSTADGPAGEPAATSGAPELPTGGDDVRAGMLRA